MSEERNHVLNLRFDNINTSEAARLTARAMEAKEECAPDGRMTALHAKRKGLGFFRRKELGSGDE